MGVALLVAFVVVVVGFFGWKSINAGAAQGASVQADKMAALSKVKGFNPAIAYDGFVTSYGLAIDPDARKFAIAIPGAEPRIYHFTQLVAAEIERNGTTVTTTKGKISTGGAAVATLLAGPVGGLLAGAKTSSVSTTDESVQLTLKLFVDDLYTPCFAIPFGGGFTDGMDTMYAAAVEKIDAWFGRFKTILASLEGQRPVGANPDAIVYSGPAPSPIALGWAARSFAP